MSELGLGLPSTIESWAVTVGEITVAASFIFLAYEYRNARIQRREDKIAQAEEEKIKHDQMYQECNNQYYKLLDQQMNDSTLEKLYDDMDIGDYKYWEKINGDPEQEKLYNFAERIYYLCGRVHHLKSMDVIDSSSGQWEEWDEWTNLLITSKIFRGVHYDANTAIQTDFGKHVNASLKNLAKSKQLEDYIVEHIKNTPDSCDCKACKPQK